MTDTETLLIVEPTPTASVEITAPRELLAGEEIPLGLTFTDRIGNVVVETVRFEVSVSSNSGKQVVASTTIADDVVADHGMSTEAVSSFDLPPDTPPTVAGIDVAATVTIKTSHGSKRERVFLTVGLLDSVRTAFETAVEVGLSLRRVSCRIAEETNTFVSEYTFDATQLPDGPDRIRLFISTGTEELQAAVAKGDRGPVPQSWQTIEEQSVRSSIIGMLPITESHRTQ